MYRTTITIDINTYAPFYPTSTDADHGFQTGESLLTALDNLLDRWPIEFEDWKITHTETMT